MAIGAIVAVALAGLRYSSASICSATNPTPDQQVASVVAPTSGIASPPAPAITLSGQVTDHPACSGPLSATR